VFGQTVYLSENFSSGNMPPEGWTIENSEENWSISNTSFAGGEIPESSYSFIPPNGTSRLISPEIDLSGVDNLKIDFRYLYDQFGTACAFGLATRSNAGNWNTVWELNNILGRSDPAFTSVIIDNDDVGEDDFQFCVVVTPGNGWINMVFDDFHIYTPNDFDMAMLNLITLPQYNTGDLFIPEAIVWNAGLQENPFDVHCKIFNTSGVVMYDESQSFSAIQVNQTETITFPEYQLTIENYLYKIEMIIDMQDDQNPDNDTIIGHINTYNTDKQLVILELATATWCSGCPGTALGADELVLNGHHVGVVEYHSNDGYDNPFSDARNDYYAVWALPTAIFDGTDFYLGGSGTGSIYDEYLPVYEDRFDIKTPYHIDIYGIETSSGNYDILLKIFNIAPVVYDNLVLHCVLTESHIPENWGFLDELNYVERLMVPDELGTSIDLINNNMEEVELSFTLESSWNIDNLELVVFVQDLDNREIYNGSKVMLTDLVSVEINEHNAYADHLKLYPNPASDILNIESKEKIDEIRIFNYSGNLIKTITGTGSSDQIIISDLAPGIYLLKIKTNKEQLIRRVIIQ